MEYQISPSQILVINFGNSELKISFNGKSYQPGNDILNVEIAQNCSEFVSIKYEINRPPEIVEEPHSFNSLTMREKEVVRWIAMGKSNPEIGMLLGISKWTAKLHVSNIMRKLDVVSRSQITYALLEKEILDTPS